MVQLAVSLEIHLRGLSVCINLPLKITVARSSISKKVVCCLSGRPNAVQRRQHGAANIAFCDF